MQKKYLYFSISCLAILICDQLSKFAILEHLSLNESMKITSFLNFTLIYNRGISFGMFAQSAFANKIFLIISLLITLILSLFFAKSKDHSKHSIFGYSLIIAGAIGNLIDRLYLGHVIDFIHVHYQNWHYPVFNIADSSIFLGCALMIFKKDNTSNSKEAKES